MPSIPQRGYGTRVFDNDIHNNNTENFAIPGTAVSGVPTGSGVMINSNDLVEVFNNRISNNDTANIVISSYFSANFAGQREVAAEFDPYPEEIFIYDNVFEGGGTKPGMDYLTEIRNALYGEQGAFPDIIWDGIVNPANQGERAIICVANGDAQLLSIDAGNEFAGAGVDMQKHNCTVDKLNPIVLASN
jgi:parallel beta-helix repeat protein